MITRSPFRALGWLPLVMASFASPASAGILWYNGDNDNRDAVTNESKVPINTGTGYVFQKSLVYDNFTVPTGQTWAITSVYSDNQMNYYVPATTATWEIRSGVSAGNGGTLVAGGDASATQVALPPVSGNYYADPEFRVTASIGSVVLTAGSYWLAVAPDSAGYYNDQSYIETTSGANAVGTPAGADGNTYISNTFPTSGPSSYNFAPMSAIEGAGNWDFSMGVIGGFAVPEPSSLVLVAVGLIGSLAWSKRRRSALAR